MEQTETKPMAQTSGPKKLPVSRSEPEPKVDETGLTGADEVDELVDGTAAQRDEAAERAAACTAELNELLVKHRCRLQPVFDPANIEPVGLMGNKLQIEATLMVLPNP